ncbi:MAG: hypothetical protein AB9869_29730 [Verrucomicrobiia bacterium]
MINLDEAQRKAVSAWIAEGLKLSDIQNRLSSEFGLRLTYMDVRLLVDDLKLTPKDTEPAKPAELGVPQKGPAPGQVPRPGAKSPTPERAAPAPPAPPGRVSVNVDTLAKPGAVVSGSVTFSDGNRAEWYLDDMGRLGLIPGQEGYRPSQQDVLTFQNELQTQLERLGM